MPSLAAATSGETRAFSSSSTEGVYISQQCEQSLRARRWASTAETAAPKERLDTHLVQPCECLRRVVRVQVESTGDPVRAASTEILAVSPSRISPTITTSVGADQAQRRGKGQTGLLVDLDLVHALQPILDRILDGDDVDLGAVDLRQRGVERGRLTRAVGPVTSNAPVGLRISSSSCERISSDMPSSCKVGALFDLSSRMTIDSPSTVGRVATQTSSRRPAAAAFGDAAVLRLAALSDVELRQHLQARRRRPSSASGFAEPPGAQSPSTDDGESSCGSKWTSEAPSSAAWKITELTRRTTGVRNPVVDLEVVGLLLLELGATPLRHRRARRTPRRASERGSPP